MVEFGSDFHRCDASFRGQSVLDTFIPQPQYYADGRLALVSIILQQQWKRIWFPTYFCYEVIEFVKQFITICFYKDHPLEENDSDIITTLPYKEGDALIRINYFGLRTKRSNTNIPVPVIEDHTHALISNWALNSDADWCIASLRKTLPIAMGGILWSPKKHTLPNPPKFIELQNTIAQTRYLAMQLKAHYLTFGGDKDTFRRLYITTEQEIDHFLTPAAIDSKSKQIIDCFDVQQWHKQKYYNWQTIYSLLHHNFQIVVGETVEETLFSTIILMPNKKKRDEFRNYLIKHSIYPAILWEIPDKVAYDKCKDFGNRMLSIHCDARYSKDDIEQMCKIINNYDTIY